MRLLLLSNSTNPGEEYLGWGKKYIQDFLGKEPVRALFIPYAAVTLSYDEYERRVESVFATLGHHVTSIHHAYNPIQEVEQAQAIVIGGGNTWQLVRKLHEQNLVQAIRQRVEDNVPYLGWSAGSNVACPTLKTTNDMPIVDPLNFHTMDLIPFQINPHYLDVHPQGHGGETREDRIREFIELNPDTYVLGLREASLLHYEDNQLKLVGEKTARLFKRGTEPRELSVNDDLGFLLEDPRVYPGPFC
ncbi:dipeptidase PepE [Bacteroidales bacterium OttesenSCG-928-J19]|nr:dipeptidase PepE [Bacteroidales bacterium OttesenSCG-928-J19]